MPFVRATKLNAYQVLARKIIVHARTSFLIPIFQRLYGRATSGHPAGRIARPAARHLGRGVADLLARHGLQLIPHYEDHDLKHVLLGYDMTPEDKLKLKAFTLGNGDWSLACVGFLLFTMLTPEGWPGLLRHYRRGRQVPPVFHWKLADYAAHDLVRLRQSIGLRVSAAKSQASVQNPAQLRALRNHPLLLLLLRTGCRRGRYRRGCGPRPPAALAVLSLALQRELWPHTPRAEAVSGAVLLGALVAAGPQVARVLWDWPAAYAGPWWLGVLLVAGARAAAVWLLIVEGVGCLWLAVLMGVTW
ncbi:MAG: hypothetical protein WKG07_12380 [Hymenobacter sp.]